jgi:hypothetical protein
MKDDPKHIETEPGETGDHISEYCQHGHLGRRSVSGREGRQLKNSRASV